jgi:hypothetical protein
LIGKVPVKLSAVATLKAAIHLLGSDFASRQPERIPPPIRQGFIAFAGLPFSLLAYLVAILGSTPKSLKAVLPFPQGTSNFRF